MIKSIATKALWNAPSIEAAVRHFEESLWSQNPPGQGFLTSRQLCERFAAFTRETFDCIAVSVWSLDPLSNHLILMGSSGVAKSDLDPPIVDCEVSLSGSAVERKRVTVIADVTSPQPDGRRFMQSRMTDHSEIKCMISMPVLDPSSPNQILLVVNLFLKSLDASSLDGDGEFSIGSELDPLVSSFARIYEMYLRDQGIRLASRLNLRLAKVPKEDPGERCAQVAKLIQEALGCDSVILYLEEPSRRELVAKAACGTRVGQTLERVFRKRDAQDVWSSNRERLVHGLRNSMPAADRAVRRILRESEWFCALVPIRDQDGRAQGAVLCLNRCPPGDPAEWRPFTYEDVAIIEAISEAFAPYLAVMLADEQRDDALSKVAHELRVPMVALRAALERIEMECEDNGWVFRYPYFREIKNYTLLMSLLLKNLDTIRKSAHLIPLEPMRTHLLPAIIAPTKRFLAPLLRQRGIHEDQIKHFGFEDLKPLYVDTLLMMQVMFNLSENAIKYYRGPADKFRIEMEAREDAQGIHISFRDWGMGVPKSMQEDIFKAGFRADNAIRSREPGDGLGLWLAREIVRRHGGDLVLGNCAQPTEFKIELPPQLKNFSPLHKYEQDSTGR